VIDALLAHSRVRAARSHIERSDEVTLARQASLSAIPAPTGAERARAARVLELLAEVGLSDVHADEVGNVCGWWNGERETGNDCIVLAAHLDTVFGPELDVSVSRRGPRLEGPGISDNARGLAALVTLAEALTNAGVATRRPVLFAATVGEEGSGDLRGVRHLFGPSAHRPIRPAAFIALDGAGIERIVHRALGARRYHVAFTGPGGHSWAAYGVANPAHAVGRAIEQITRIPTPHAPFATLRAGSRTTHSVVRIGGGTSLNCIPQTAWFDVDLRSEDPRELELLDAAVQRALDEVLADENQRRIPGSAPLAVEVRRVGDRPSGLTPRTHPLVQAAVAATRAVGHEHQLACASTDANVPIALGVPAVALGAGGRSGDAHLPTEWYENDKGALGIVRALLVTAAMAEAC
jgi:tripeptide aminopeptidase